MDVGVWMWVCGCGWSGRGRAARRTFSQRFSRRFRSTFASALSPLLPPPGGKPRRLSNATEPLGGASPATIFISESMTTTGAPAKKLALTLSSVSLPSAVEMSAHSPIDNVFRVVAKPTSNASGEVKAVMYPTLPNVHAGSERSAQSPRECSAQLGAVVPGICVVFTWRTAAPTGPPCSRNTRSK